MNKTPKLHSPNADRNERLKALVLTGIATPGAKRVYESSLNDFFEWVDTVPGRPFNKATVNEYKDHLIGRGLAPSTINVRMCAVRALAKEMLDNDALDVVLAQGISHVKGIRGTGVRMGRWLNEADAQHMLDAPDRSKLRGVRDAAILSCMLGCGLRREEVACLTIGHFRLVEKRWVIADVESKGRIRNVAAPHWAKDAIDMYVAKIKGTMNYSNALMRWQDTQPGKPVPLWCGVTKSDEVKELGLTSQAMYNIVAQYAQQIGVGKLAPHDMRRSYAKLSSAGGADIRDIQRSLGHGSLTTTEIYLGADDNFATPPCDFIKVKGGADKKENENKRVDNK